MGLVGQTPLAALDELVDPPMFGQFAELYPPPPPPCGPGAVDGLGAEGVEVLDCA